MFKLDLRILVLICYVNKHTNIYAPKKTRAYQLYYLQVYICDGRMKILGTMQIVSYVMEE